MQPARYNGHCRKACIGTAIARGHGAYRPVTRPQAVQEWRAGSPARAVRATGQNALLEEGVETTSDGERERERERERETAASGHSPAWDTRESRAPTKKALSSEETTAGEVSGGKVAWPSARE
jgi:hypothetical protein